MAATQAQLDYLLFMKLTESLDVTPRCESNYCAEDMHREAHAAEWLAVFTCKHDVYWCSDRLAEYQAVHYNEGVRCDNHPEPIVVWLTNMVPVTS